MAGGKEAKEGRREGRKDPTLRSLFWELIVLKDFSRPVTTPPRRRRGYLLLVDDVDARLDVGERVRRGEDGLALELLVQVAVGAAVQRERRAVHEAPQVVVLVEVRDAVLHLVRVEVRLHVRDLDEGLGDEDTRTRGHAGAG